MELKYRLRIVIEKLSFLEWKINCKLAMCKECTGECPQLKAIRGKYLGDN